VVAAAGAQTMKMQRPIRLDLDLLRPGLFFGGGLMLVAATLFGLQKWAFDQTQTQHQQTQAAFQAAETERDQLARQHSQMQAQLPDYQWLLSYRLFDLEPRLEWVEHLIRQQQQPHRLILGYDVAAQGDFDAAPLRGVYRIRASQMKLSIDSLHEGDFFGLIDRMQQNRDGYFLPRRCVLELIETRLDRQTSQELPVEAECEFDWVSLIKQNPEESP
jgi:hypothetical protein